jgi:5-methylcytosine-specific restriction enzyme A
MVRHLEAVDARELHNMQTGSRWRSIRARHLEQQPLCRWCQIKGKVVAATIAHHDVPHKGCRKKFYTGELVSLCQACHDKTAQQIERRGFSTEIGPDGNPADPNHPWNS